MNRTTKFRGKDIKTGKWRCGDLIENQGRFFIYHASSETTIKDNDDNSITVVAIEVDPETVGEFTGLLDKNGEEIYEEDLLNNEFGGIWAVRFNKDGFWECYDDPNGGYFLSDYLKSSAIISNIHDNPELLNTK